MRTGSTNPRFNSAIPSLLGLVAGIASIVLHYVDGKPKIAYAETSIILTQFTEAAKAREKFGEYSKEWERQKKVINDSLTAAMNRIKSGYESAGKDEKAKLRADLEKWNSDLVRYSQAVSKMSEEKDKELMEPVIGKVNTYLKEWGEEKNYTFIFGTLQGGNLLQADEAHNITTKFLADLNDHYRSAPLTQPDSVTVSSKRTE